MSQCCDARPIRRAEAGLAAVSPIDIDISRAWDEAITNSGDCRGHRHTLVQLHITHRRSYTDNGTSLGQLLQHQSGTMPLLYFKIRMDRDVHSPYYIPSKSLWYMKGIESPGNISRKPPKYGPHEQRLSREFSIGSQRGEAPGPFRCSDIHSRP